MDNTIEIFTDGASRGNPGRGGYAAILKFNNKEKIISNGFRLTTNNRMELMAVINALQLLKTTHFPIIIYTDSKYIVNAINKKWVFGWHKNNWRNANPDLWQALFNLYKKFNNIEFKWVKGHNGHAYNERCDKLAVSAANSLHLNIDEYYEQLKS